MPSMSSMSKLHCCRARSINWPAKVRVMPLGMPIFTARPEWAAAAWRRFRSSTARRMATASRSTASPSTVRLTPRAERSSSWVPSSSSSALICAVKAGCTMCRADAALVMLRRWAVSTK
ncbi:Uncharacterised protein [Bordetella pertussis]|nr:Uncharacterised protein [Bordetella pertussis]